MRRTRTKALTAKGEHDEVLIAFRTDAARRKKLKLLALNRSRSMQDLLTEAVDLILKKYRPT